MNRVFLVLSLLAALSGCSVQRAETAAIAKTQLVGMTKEQVLQCMGGPASTARAGNTEVWTYYSGGDAYTSGNATAYTFGSTTTAYANARTRTRYCKIDLILNDDRISRVNYSGRTGGIITEGEQCAFAVQNCVSSK